MNPLRFLFVILAAVITSLLWDWAALVIMFSLGIVALCVWLSVRYK